MARSGDDKRTAVMEAALELFVERGFHSAPTSLIAERAGVGVGTIYRYFPNKEELVHSLFDEIHRRFHQHFGIRLDPGRPLRERMTLLLSRLLEIFIESPRDFKFLEQYYYSPFSAAPHREIPDEEHDTLRKLLREGRESGLLKDAPIGILQCIVIGPVISLAKDHISGRISVDASTVQLAAEACWDAVASPGNRVGRKETLAGRKETI